MRSSRLLASTLAASLLLAGCNDKPAEGTNAAPAAPGGGAAAQAPTPKPRLDAAAQARRDQIASLDKVAEQAPPEHRKILKAMQGIMMEVETSMDAFLYRSQKAGDEGTFNPAKLTTAEALDNADAEAKWLRMEVLRVEGETKRMPAKLRDAVLKAGATNNDADTIVKDASEGGRFDLIAKLRHAEAEKIEQLQKQFAILREHVGKWTASDAGGVKFESAEAQKAYDAAAAEYARIDTEQNATIDALQRIGG